MTTDNPADDAAEAAEDLRELSEGLIALLDASTARFFSADRPRYALWLAIVATTDALRKQLLAAVAQDAADQARVEALVADLWTTCVTPTAPRSN